jgi:hypothetical protein
MLFSIISFRKGYVNECVFRHYFDMSLSLMWNVEIEDLQTVMPMFFNVKQALLYGAV